MDEQVALSGFEPKANLERLFLESILDKLKNAVSSAGGPEELLTYKCVTGYSVVSFLNLTAFRLSLRGKQHYISIPTAFLDLIPDSYPQQKMKSDTKYIRILVTDETPIESYTDFLCLLARETVNRYPKEWDCCSRYLECSDAKACVHPDKSFAMVCGYRKILASGKIFYGRNRNID